MQSSETRQFMLRDSYNGERDGIQGRKWSPSPEIAGNYNDLVRQAKITPARTLISCAT
jgi:hypothetical protein